MVLSESPEVEGAAGVVLVGICVACREGPADNELTI
jgi:hypothetical protein